MSVYQFDFAHLTVGDYTALVTAAESRNTVAFLSVVNAFSDIDVFSLPFLNFNHSRSSLEMRLTRTPNLPIRYCGYFVKHLQVRNDHNNDSTPLAIRTL